MTFCLFSLDTSNHSIFCFRYLFRYVEILFLFNIQDSHSGDTGSPLIIYSKENQQYELVGIASFRNECTTEGLFTRILTFVDWISSTLDNPPPIPTIPLVPSTAATTTPPENLGKL